MAHTGSETRNEPCDFAAKTIALKLEQYQRNSSKTRLVRSVLLGEASAPVDLFDAHYFYFYQDSINESLRVGVFAEFRTQLR